MSHLSQTFDPEAASVSVARRFVRQALRDLGTDGAVDTAQTLVSELATNAVIHARTGYTVQVDCEGETVRVSVLDRSPAKARVRNYGTDATTGRGLRLVDALASGWGVATEADGKAVWFEVPAGGEDDTSDADTWTEAADVEALLAQFDDGSDADVRTMVRDGAAVTIGLVRRAA